MENGIDLTGVDPARWPEIRRRVEILDEYVKIKRPRREVRMRYAARMGLAESQFMHLSRIWREKRCASALPGARSRIGVERARRLPARSLDLARRTIEDMGPAARRVDVLAEVERRCRREAVPKPSDSTVSNMLAEARASLATATSFGPEILIDECAIRLPAIDGAEVFLPRVLMAVLLPERIILAAEICCEPAGRPSPQRLAEQLERAEIGDMLLPTRAPHLDAAGRAAVSAIELSEIPPGSPTLARVLGSRLGGLGLIYQPSKARPGSALIGTRHASPLGREDVLHAIRAAIADHNAQCLELPCALVSPESAATPVRPPR